MDTLIRSGSAKCIRLIAYDRRPSVHPAWVAISIYSFYEPSADPHVDQPLYQAEDGITVNREMRIRHDTVFVREWATLPVGLHGADTLVPLCLLRFTFNGQGFIHPRCVALVPRSLLSHTEMIKIVRHYRYLVKAFKAAPVEKVTYGESRRDSLRVELLTCMKPLLAAALTGNPEAKRAFESFSKNAPLDADYSEEFVELQYFYDHANP